MLKTAFSGSPSQRQVLVAFLWQHFQVLKLSGNSWPRGLQEWLTGKGLHTNSMLMNGEQPADKGWRGRVRQAKSMSTPGRQRAAGAGEATENKGLPTAPVCGDSLKTDSPRQHADWNGVVSDMMLFPIDSKTGPLGKSCLSVSPAAIVNAVHIRASWARGHST